MHVEHRFRSLSFDPCGRWTWELVEKLQVRRKPRQQLVAVLVLEIEMMSMHLQQRRLWHRRPSCFCPSVLRVILALTLGTSCLLLRAGEEEEISQMPSLSTLAWISVAILATIFAYLKLVLWILRRAFRVADGHSYKNVESQLLQGRHEKDLHLLKQMTRDVYWLKAEHKSETAANVIVLGWGGLCVCVCLCHRS